MQEFSIFKKIRETQRYGNMNTKTSADFGHKSYGKRCYQSLALFFYSPAPHVQLKKCPLPLSILLEILISIKNKILALQD